VKIAFRRFGELALFSLGSELGMSGLFAM